MIDKRSILYVGLLLVATTLLYLNSFPGAFHFDDFPLILENPRITSPYFSYMAFLDQYGGRPLTLWTFHWNYHLFGEDPFGYHLVSLFLHLLVCVELYFLILQLFKQRFLAWTSALFFALHPLQTQAVNYIWSRSMLLMSVFGLAALLLIRKYPWKALICFQLAIWSRGEAIVLLIPLLFLNRINWKIPVLIGSVNLILILYSLSFYNPLEIAWNHPDILGYWFSQLSAFWSYLSLMVWPVGLNLDHDFHAFDFVRSMAILALFLVLLILAFLFRKKHTLPILGILWIIILLAPSLLIPNSDLFNESRAYLALAGFSLVAAWVFQNILNKNNPSLSIVVIILTVWFFVPITLSRNKIWNDDLALWNDAVSKSPGKERPHYNLGVALFRSGQNDQAELEFHIAAQINPTEDSNYVALGYCAEQRLRFSTAMSFYRQALLLNPSNRYASMGLKRTKEKVNWRQTL